VIQVTANLSDEVAGYLQNRKRKELSQLEERYGAAIIIQSDPLIPPGEGTLDFSKQTDVE
jgi:Ribonuclease G/E